MTNLLLDTDAAPIVHMEERSDVINHLFAEHNKDPRGAYADKVRAEVALKIMDARQRAEEEEKRLNGPA